MVLESIKRVYNLHCIVISEVVKMTRSPDSCSGDCDIFDYYQNVARAGFGDMLHDTERNQKYYLGIQEVINIFHSRGMPANVLDIGTGTGLLSMMAVRCGADSVTACEAFAPMAECASQIIQKNGMQDKIKLIRKRSTDIIVGSGGDMPEKANILVTEVFDTELIGEGAISIFNHAHKYLLQEDCLVVPHCGTIYVQLIESALALAWNKPKAIADLDGQILLKIPPTIEECPGAVAVHDIQLSQFPESMFKAISAPVALFDFDFSGKTIIPATRIIDKQIKVQKNGIGQMVFMWWDLKMDPNDKIILSCAPYWAHPDFNSKQHNVDDKIPIQNTIPWRDHWMQAIYYLPKSMLITADNDVTLRAAHDEFSFWFEMIKDSHGERNTERPTCECLFHITYSRTRIAQLSESLRNKKYVQYLENTINSSSKVLVLSEGSLLGLAISCFGASTVYIIEPNKTSNSLMKSLIDYNKLKNIALLDSVAEISNLNEITHVFGEPFFMSSTSAFDNLHFHKLLTEIKTQLPENVIISPNSAKVYGIPVEFLDLHKIAIPVNQCETFDMKIYDYLLHDASKLADNVIESQPLWEYPCYANAEPNLCLMIDFSKSQNINKRIDFPIEKSNGVVFWIEWEIGNYKISSTGPTTKIDVNQLVSWNMNCQQSVHLIRSMNKQISFEIIYNEGEILFKLI